MKQPLNYITYTLLLLSALVSPVAWAPNYLAGDVAPRGNPDGQLNAGDLVVLQRIAIGQVTADAYEQIVGDIAPLGAPDGQINVADVLVLQRAIFGQISLPSVGVNPPATPLPDLLGSPTADNLLIVSGMADAGSTIRVYANAAMVASGTTGADGKFRVVAPLTEGVNVIQLSAVANSVESPLSSTQTVVLDSVAPTIGGADSVTSGSGFGRIKVSGSTEPGIQVRIDTANGQTAFGISDVNGYFLIELNGQVGDALSVRAIDVAGNSSVPSNFIQSVGATPGQFQVDDSGGANYTIPLQVPPGTAGMQPELSLTFNSRTGNGLLGVGWSLGGLSTITRCPQTLAEDNAVGTVQFDINDRFCLDGERLIAISGAYGSNGTEYRTERESFTRVISYGTAGSGPAWFKVWTKSGQVMEYGNTSDSFIEANTQGGTPRVEALVWAVDRIEDRVGNYLMVDYNEDTVNGVYRPSAIRYTANNTAGLAASQKVTFSYQARPDQIDKYLGGSRLRRTQRLTAINTYDGATLVKQYKLAYDTGSVSKRSRLIKVWECDGANSCYPPTVFTWQNGSNTLVNDSAWATGKYASLSQSVFIGDTTGDGRDDVILGPDYSNQWYLLHSTGSSFDDGSPTTGGVWFDSTSYPGGIPCQQEPNFVHGMDANANGTLDIVVAPANISGDIYTLDSGGATAYASNEGNFNILGACGGDPFFHMDTNGDGLVDLIRRGDLLVVGSTAPGFELRGTWRPANLPTSWDPARALEIDMNADGMADLLSGPDDSGKWTVLQSTGSTFALKTWATSLFPNWYYASRPMDVNGDGLPDEVLGPNPSGNWFVLINTGTGFINAGRWASNLFGSWAEDLGALARIRPMDTNGDGLQDLLLGPDSSGNWMALESTGSGFVQKLKLSNAYAGWTSTANAKKIRLADLDGNGRADLLLGPDNSGNWYAIRQTGTILDQMVSIRSLTVTTGITYTQYRGSASPFITSYPTQDLTAPITVVDTVSTDDGIGGNYQTTYGYNGPRIDLHGRGFLGFGSMTHADSRNAVTTTTRHSQDYPYTGMVTSITQKDAQGKLLNETTNTLASLELDNAGSRVCTIACQTSNTSSRRHFPYVATSVEKSYNLDSGVRETLVQTDSVYDNYGNVTRLTVTTQGPRQTPVSYVKKTVNTYTDNATSWLLGRLTRAEVTHSGPGQPPITRVSAFAYDTRGLLIQEVVEPDQPNTPFTLTTDYGYDAFGNRNSVTVTGLKGVTVSAGQQVRVTSTQYDAKGRFPVSTTNALNQTETYTYDGRFGTRTRLTGPNDLITTWQYDGFGRLTKETRADGTVSTVSYRWCGTDCPNGGYATESRASGSAPVTRYRDALNRDILSQTQSLDGRIVNRRTVYDTQGRPIQVSEPYFTGDPPVWTTTSYDLLDRPKVITSPLGKVMRMSYGMGLDTLTTVDTLDGVNGATTKTRNAIGQTVSVTDRLGSVIRYAYNAVGNLTTTTDPASNVVQLGYDIRGRKRTMSDPDMGNWVYAYNGFGELVSQTDARGQTVTMSYDKLGRMIARSESEGTSTWIYDTTSAASKGIGKLARETGPGGYLRTQTYDSLGRPVRTATTIAGKMYSMSTAYDAFSHVAQTTYPTGFAVRNVYNSRGDVLEVRDAANDTVFWNAESQNARGQATQFRLGNGLSTVKSFDVVGRPTLITTGFGTGSAVQNQQFDYDVHGNLKTRTDFNQTPPSGTGNLVETFSYDTLFRLKSATLTGIGVRSYSYNALGNITSKTGVGSYTYGSGINGTTQAGPHAVKTAGGVSYSYNANGNQISGDGRTITYTSFNKAKTISKGATTYTYAYGTDHHRISQTGPNHTTVYINPRLDSGAHYEQETRNGQIEDKHYIYGGSGVVAIHTQKHPVTQPTNVTANTRYLHTDHLGSIVSITDEAGQAVEAFGYSPFGARRNASGTAPAGLLTSGITHHGYTGHEMLDDFGLIHANARLYDPRLGRFLNADPTIQFAGNLQSYNRYSYVLNNPLSFTDPSGLGIFSKLKKAFKKLFKNKFFRLGLAIVAGYAAGAFVLGQLATGALGTLSSATVFAASGFAGGFVAGGITTGSFKGAIIGGLMGAAFGFVGHAPVLGSFRSLRGGGVILHGLVGGAFSRAQGGSFQSGFLSAGFAKFSGPFTRTGNPIGNAVAGAVAGGVGAELGGGKFANGAQTGAFSYLFNDALGKVFKSDVTPEENRKLGEFSSNPGISDNAVLNATSNCAQASICMMRLNEIENALTVDVVPGPNENGSPRNIRDVIKRFLPSPTDLGVGMLKIGTCTQLNADACNGVGLPANPRPSREFVDGIIKGR